jgi:glutamate 5-kinase
MGSLVVKLGSSLVADERGEVREDVLGQVCDELAALSGS